MNKLIKENQKCSCKAKKAPLANKNGGGESRKDGRSKGSSSSEEGGTSTDPKDTEKENVFAPAT